MIWVDLAVERVHWSPYGVQWSPVESIWIMGGTDKTSKGGEPNFQYPGLSGGAIGAGILSGTSQTLPMGTGMLSGTGQTLPVGPVFRCTEGNRWDIQQLPEPAGWFYRTTNSYHSWHRRTRIRQVLYWHSCFK